MANNGSSGDTAFVLAGGGSLGAIQVGMLRELVTHGVRPNIVVGSSVERSTGHISPPIEPRRA
jgi:NTE family protein